jgi:hypothetical protein
MPLGSLAFLLRRGGERVLGVLSTIMAAIFPRSKPTSTGPVQSSNKPPPNQLTAIELDTAKTELVESILQGVISPPPQAYAK